MSLDPARIVGVACPMIGFIALIVVAVMLIAGHLRERKSKP